MSRADFEKHIKDYYNINPEYPWASKATYAVYRHSDNNKWFAVVMEIPKNKIGISESGTIQVVNLKCDPLLIGSLIAEKGIYKAYHMNKTHWITVSLDDSVDDDKIKWLLSISFDLTARRR